MYKLMNGDCIIATSKSLIWTNRIISSLQAYFPNMDFTFTDWEGEEE